MPEISIDIESKRPVIAANLEQLRYLVFQGMKGDTGQSAYELACSLGFDGSEEEWLASLVGPQGEPGEPGETGPRGEPGQRGEAGPAGADGKNYGIVVDGSVDHVLVLKSEELEIKGDLGYETIDFSDYTVQNGRINIKDRKFIPMGSSVYRFVLIQPDTSWARLLVHQPEVGNTSAYNYGVVAFLTSNSLVDNELAPLCPSDSNLHNALPGTSLLLDIPSDCAYIYVLVRNNGRNRDVTPVMYALTENGQLRTITEFIGAGSLYGQIASFGESGVFTGEFEITIPYSGDNRNQIFSCEAMYTLTGDAKPPTIQFSLGSGTNWTTRYELGTKDFPTLKQWRVVRYPNDESDVTVSFSIPDGCSVKITDFRAEYSDQVCRVSSGIRMNGHRRMPTTPYDTIQGAILAAKAGYAAMIQIPKRTYDGVWICAHDDSIDVNSTDIRQADGTKLPSSYNGKKWSDISYATEASVWDWGVSKNARFAGTGPMTLEQFFTVCAKTGMMPMLSIHGGTVAPTSTELEEIKALAKKCGVLGKLGLKGPESVIPSLYSAFGNDIESYTLNVSGGQETTGTINSAIDTMNSLTGCTVRRVIELLKSTAYLAYFGEEGTTFDAFGMISNAGFGCSIAIQSYAGSPTGYTSQVQFIHGIDMEYWMTQHGVTEFTDEYNWSTGLNW